VPVHPVPRLQSRIGPLLFAEVAYIRASGPEDSQAQELEHGHEGEVVRVRGLVAGGLRGSRNLALTALLQSVIRVRCAHTIDAITASFWGRCRSALS